MGNWKDTPKGGVINRRGPTSWLAIPCNKVGMNSMLEFATESEAMTYADNPTTWSGWGTPPPGGKVPHLTN